MPRRIRVAVFAVLTFAASLAARPLEVGVPFPLTHTRYAAATGHPHLVSNGAEVFLFWGTDTNIRFTRLGENAPPSRAVIARTHGDNYAVLWTGSHFLLVLGRTQFTSIPDDDDIFGLRVDVNGVPMGQPFLLVDGGQTPRIAFDGTSVLMLFRRAGSDQVFAQRLNTDGTPHAEAKATGVEGNIQTIASNGTSFAAIVAGRFDRKLVMLDRDANVQSVSTLNEEHRRFWSTLASDGRRFLLVDSFGSPVHARLVDADGTVGPSLAIDEAHGWDFTPASVAWTGSKWMVAWAISPNQLPGGVEKTFTIAQLDADARAVEQREQRGGVWVSLAAHGERVKAAWLPQLEYGDIIQVADVPLREQSGVTSSFAAARQDVRATASASHGTLVLWEENYQLHAGIRARDGRWREQIVWPHQSFTVSAASDGQQFAILFTTPDGWYTMKLDGDGTPLGEAQKVDGYPRDILWTGHEYVLIKDSESRIIAAGDNGFYAVSIITGPFQTPGGSPRLGVTGIRLGPDFQPLDAQPTTFVLEKTDTIFEAAAGWDGTQYVVVWSTANGITAAHVPADGGAPTIRSIASDDLAGELRVTRVSGGAAIDWMNYPDSKRLSFLFADGAKTEPMTLRASSATEIAALPDGNVALVETLLQNDAPAEGTHRVSMTVLAPLLPQRPQSLQANAIVRGEVAELRWSAPPEAVSGYRVEYRIEDGPWVELDRTLSPDERSASIPTRRKRAALRVRAWNDAGPGAYSQTIVVNTGRRRAVR